MTEIPVFGEGGPVSGAQAVDRALSLLSLVAAGGDAGAQLATLVVGSGLNKPTVRRQLMALMRAGLVEQDETSRRYFLGPQLYVLGHLASRRHGLLEQAAESLRRISESCGDTSFVSSRQGDWAVCLHRQEGPHPVRTHALQTGDQNPLGIGAGSLAMLCALPEQEREAVIERIGPALPGYPGYTAETIRADMVETLDRGFALNPGRVHPSSWGIGVPLLFPDGRLAGALSIAAVDSRMRPERQKELSQLLLREAGVVEARIAKLFGPAGAIARR